MWRELKHIIAFALMLTVGASVIGAAQSGQQKSDTYTWSGELVSVDTAAMAITVKSRVAYQDAVSELKQFKPGDKVWVVWSGVHDYSDAVRQVRRFDANDKSNENFMLPAELVSPQSLNQYITIRVRVPETSLAALKTVNPGQWVTVTSRHRPASEAEAVVAVKPFVVQTTTTTN
jgi:hypothetical protein